MNRLVDVGETSLEQKITFFFLFAENDLIIVISYQVQHNGGVEILSELNETTTKKNIPWKNKLHIE